jgi:hypothetical protein
MEMVKKPIRQPAKAPAAPGATGASPLQKRVLEAPTRADAERVFRDHLLSRYLRVIAHGADVIEVAPRPGHRISFSDEFDGDRRRVRILVAPIKPPSG